jgi:hypothetical protein
VSTDDRNRPAEGDAVIAAIDDVSRAVEGNVSDEHDLLDELARVRQDRVVGIPLGETIGDTGKPRSLTLLSRIVNRLNLSSARLRRAFVVSLVEEGEGVNSVARRFHVTHQRISAILRRGKHNGA